jgi:Ca-activated chloride channel family protein
MFDPKTFALASGLLFWLTPGARARAGTGSIEGTVQVKGGGPLAGAIVTVDQTGLRAVTGRDGKFALGRVPAGEQTVRVRLVGFAPASLTVNVVEGQSVSVAFALEAARAELDELVKSSVAYRIGQVMTMSPRPAMAATMFHRDAAFNTEEYRHYRDNGWQSPDRRPLSTFSIDVDAASYTNIRRFVTQHQLPPKDAVRIEEMVNYFRYDYPDPDGDEPFSVTTELGGAPWNPTHKLALIGLQGRRMSIDQLPPTNLVFLLDVSGSMDDPAKLPLVKQAFRLLVNELRPIDRVAIVVYAGAAGLVLPPTSGDQKDRILDAIEQLQAGGSTAGGAGLQLAYATARQSFLRGGNNRVILATDGDFNVGPSSDGELVRMIEERRQDGIFLTVLGFGMGNLKDSKMVQLADKGNGHYAYVDNLLEAKKVFVKELGATLLTIAKDVKIQVEFNPARVRSYRLIGYEKRLLNDEDFNDDTKDAGELGAGHSVTALYEIVPVGAEPPAGAGSVDPLKYQTGGRTRTGSGDWLTVKLRYKEPTGTASKLIDRVVKSEGGAPSTDFRFASAVAGVGMLLRDSEYKGSATLASMLTLARGARGHDEEGYRAEFVRIVEQIEGMVPAVVGRR